MYARSENGKVIIKVSSLYIKQDDIDGKTLYKVKASGEGRRSPITVKTFEEEYEALMFLSRVGRKFHNNVLDGGDIE